MIDINHSKIENIESIIDINQSIIDKNESIIQIIESLKSWKTINY